MHWPTFLSNRRARHMWTKWSMCLKGPYINDVSREGGGGLAKFWPKEGEVAWIGYWHGGGGQNPENLDDVIYVWPPNDRRARHMESALVDVSWQQKSRHRWTKWKMLRSTCPSDRRARISDRAWWEQQDGRSKHAPKSQMFPFYPQQKKSVDIWRWYRGMTALAIGHTTNNEPSKAGAYDAPKKGEAQAGLTKLFQLIAARNGWSLLPFTWAKFMEANMINEAIGGNLCDFVCTCFVSVMGEEQRCLTDQLDWRPMALSLLQQFSDQGSAIK